MTFSEYDEAILFHLKQLNLNMTPKLGEGHVEFINNNTQRQLGVFWKLYPLIK